MKKEKRKRWIIYSLILFLLYFFIFPYPIGKELVFRPKKVHNLHSYKPVTEISEAREIKWFRNGDFFGYIDENGDIIYLDSSWYNVTVSSRGFINYSSIQGTNQNLVFFDPSGNIKSSIQTPGYPLLDDSGERLFIIKTDATGLKEITVEGGELWSASFTSLLTSLSSSTEYTLLGLLNGFLKLFDKQGNCIYSISTAKDKPSVVYGTAISNRGKEIAAIYGINPQRLFFTRQKNLKFTKPVMKDIDSSFKTSIFMDFSSDNRCLFFPGNKKLNTMDFNNNKLFSIPLNGSFSGLSSNEESGVVAVLANDKTLLNDKTSSSDSKKNHEVVIFKPFDLVFLKLLFKADKSFVRFMYDFLVLGIDENILIIDLLEI